MAVVVLGLFSNNIQGIEGAILLAIGHGFFLEVILSVSYVNAPQLKQLRACLVTCM